jgi:hypothetical protein
MQQQQGKKWGKKKKKQEAQKPSLTGKNDTQAGCSCLSQWEVKPGGPTLSGCANPDNDPLVSIGIHTGSSMPLKAASSPQSGLNSGQYRQLGDCSDS